MGFPCECGVSKEEASAQTSTKYLLTKFSLDWHRAKREEYTMSFVLTSNHLLTNFSNVYSLQGTRLQNMILYVSCWKKNVFENETSLLHLNNICLSLQSIQSVPHMVLVFSNATAKSKMWHKVSFKFKLSWFEFRIFLFLDWLPYQG